ncbi:MAG TPA: LytTR family DNA-binding domain-containing protein [Acidobacteriaceae bacterium]|nr:LytTR family DNA-binding domain-containing protein [Acidobacteriaceae bacterium]
MKLRTYLVDDEPLALDRLRRLLENTGRVELTGSTTRPEEAVAALTRNPPDVCFLDIQMPQLNGFEVLARLPSQPIVVFTTAYNQHALRAFGENAVDYLLKPVEPETLERALNKVERLRGAGPPAQPDLEFLLRQIAGSLRESKAEFPSRIATRLGDRLCFLDLDRVSHFYAEDKLTYAVSEGKSYCIDHAIAELERKLDPSQFFRIHRGTLVNLAWVREVSSLPGGALNVRLKDAKNTDLTAARDRAREFKARAAF